MSELRYAYDLYPRDDPRDGARILRFSDLIEAEWNAEANGTGSGLIVLPGDSPDAAFIDPRGLQYIRVVEIDPDTVDGATLSGFAERVVFGFFLDTGSFDALTEQNTKRLTFGGAGTLSYWARAVMAPHTYIHAVFTGQDPFDRTWRLDQQSTVFANGNYTGAMLWRVLYELSHFRSGATYTHKHADGIIYTDAHDDDRTESAVPDAVIDFTAFLDSNGNAWTEKVGEFRVSVLDNGLSVIRLLMELGAYVEMDPDTFETRAYQASSHRRDRTGGAWGASVIRFQSPIDGTLDTGNILSDAKRALTAHIQRSTMWAGGGDDVYAKATGTFDIPWEGGLNSDANDLDALEVQADRQITARSDAGDTLRVRTVPIDDPASGYYRPLHSTGVLLDDLATVHNGSGQWDFDEQTFPVAAVGGKLREGGDWDTFVDLGASFRPMEGRQFQVAALGAHSHLQLCAPAQPGNTASCAVSPSAMTEIATPNGDFEMGDDTNWESLVTPGAGDPSGEGGSWFFTNTGFASAIVYRGWLGDTFIAGQTYVVRVWGNNAAYISYEFGHQGSADFTTKVGSDLGYNCLEWTPSANRTGVEFWIRRNGNGTFLVDNLQLYTGGGGSNPLNGTSKYAARCDKSEHEILARDPTVNDDESTGYPRRTIWHNSSSGATFISTDGTEGAAVWVEIGGGGVDLSAINFLVGTASGDLSAEIVVGATPGGELGGTWAAPTVDATHSGSTHSAATDTHIADTADAHDASAISFVPNGSIAATDVQAAIQEVRDEASAGAHAATHADGGADEVTVEGLGTTETDTSLVLAPDGTGGVEFRVEAVGAGIAGELVTDTIIGDGVEDTFALSVAPTGTWALVSTNGADLLPTEYAISGSDIVFDVAPVNLSESLVTFITGGFTSPATDPSDIVDPTIATAEDVALKLNALMANLRTAGIIV